MAPLKFICVKCGHQECETGEIRVAGGFWSKIFNVEGKKFASVTCKNCRYSEFYKTDSSMLGNIFDLFSG